MDKGAWWVIVHGFAKSQTRLTEHAQTHTHIHIHTHTHTHTILGRWICLERKGLFALMTHSVLHKAQCSGFLRTSLRQSQNQIYLVYETVRHFNHGDSFYVVPWGQASR